MRPLRCHEHMGLRQLIRRLPELLRRPARPAPFGHQLDRLDPDLPDLLHRDLHGSLHRRRLLPARAPGRHRLHHPGHLHHVGRHTVLAPDPLTRPVPGHRQRLPLLPRHLHAVDVLLHEALPRYRNRRLGVCHRRSHLPRYGPPVAAHRWFRMGCPCHRVRAARYAALRQRLHEIPPPAAADGESCRVGCF